jgi:hypothetical protein
MSSFVFASPDVLASAAEDLRTGGHGGAGGYGSLTGTDDTAGGDGSPGANFP